jgi:FtsP/CotA-like multicopper oxidase with cupredoxin domain
VAGGGAKLAEAGQDRPPPPETPSHPHAGTAHAGTRGEVDHRRNGFDPHEVLTDFDGGRVTRLPGGRTLREWTLVAADHEVEVAPGVMYAAWSYNGRVPGPTLRATEGDLLRIRLVNASPHPHTIHFHGIHPALHDGVPGAGAGGLVQTGGQFTYEFEARPFGLHLYHCHSFPLASHIAKGLYGLFVIDPKEGRPPARELAMVQNAFDTNFDFGNEVYAVNSIAFAYLNRPVEVKKDELVRIYLANMVEFDPINSLHLHANFFHYYPTGTSLQPTEFSDIVSQVQGQRGILEVRFPNRGQFMFHAHKSEFAELGWAGLFQVS